MANVTFRLFDKAFQELYYLYVDVKLADRESGEDSEHAFRKYCEYYAVIKVIARIFDRDATELSMSIENLYRANHE